MIYTLGLLQTWLIPQHSISAFPKSVTTYSVLVLCSWTFYSLLSILLHVNQNVFFYWNVLHLSYQDLLWCVMRFRICMMLKAELFGLWLRVVLLEFMPHLQILITEWVIKISFNLTTCTLTHQRILSAFVLGYKLMFLSLREFFVSTWIFSNIGRNYTQFA